MCDFTVFIVSPSSRAMSLFGAPAAIRATTWVSRGVSRMRRDACATPLSTRSRATIRSPEWTFSKAATSSTAGSSLER